MEPRLITFENGPLDGETWTVEGHHVVAPGDGYDVWHYYPDPTDPTAAWQGTLVRSPIGHSDTTK